LTLCTPPVRPTLLHIQIIRFDFGFGQVRTRMTEWILTPKNTLSTAIALAQARFVAMMGAELAA